MRLVRLVAAGLALGAFAGFLGALLRPRSVHTYCTIDTGSADAVSLRETECKPESQPESGSGSSDRLFADQRQGAAVSVA